MKKIIFIVFAILQISQLQSQILFGYKKPLERAELNEIFWGKNDKYKNEIAVPEKYKGESAVILFKMEDYDFNSFETNVRYSEFFRMRVKLLDQAAVTEFSEFKFSFYTYSWRYYNSTEVGIKIIKPDGKETVIDVDKETVFTDSDKRIAIPSLEVGDIIDIYHYGTQLFFSPYGHVFDPIEKVFSSNYPVMNYKLTFQVENNFFVNFNTYNEGPKLKQLPKGKGDERRYEITATDIQKNEIPRWFYPLVELPCYKFQVVFAKSETNEDWANAFINDSEKEIKSNVSKEDIFEFYKNRFKTSPVSLFVDLGNYLETKNYTSDEEKIKDIYYYARHQYFTRYIEGMILEDQKIIYDPYSYYDKSFIFFRSEVSFINYFMMVLKKMNISYDILVATNRENGPIQDLLLKSNINVLLKVNTKEPLIFGYFDPFTTPDVIPYNLENSEAYLLKVEDNKKVEDIELYKLPKSSHKDNVTMHDINVSLNSQFDKVNVVRITSEIGQNKIYDQENKVMFLDVINEDHNKYNTPHFFSLVKNKKTKDESEKKYNAFINTRKEERLESTKNTLKEEFDLEMEDITLELLNSGRYGKNDSLKFKEKFTITSPLVKKAGNNYTFEIGKLISSQVEIKEKEYTRNNNVYLTFPRSFKTQIVFEIPNGYSISGVEKLNKNVTNETGTFISNAEIKGNQLIIKTSKEYFNYYETKDNWLKMVEFLDAAYQFTQEKILLKKN